MKTSWQVPGDPGRWSHFALGVTLFAWPCVFGLQRKRRGDGHNYDAIALHLGPLEIEFAWDSAAT